MEASGRGRRGGEGGNEFQVEKENECNDEDEWEYVEEGPAEIIWQGNEIIFKKKKVKVPKKKSEDQQTRHEDDRPTSNPLPPQSEAFSDYKNSSVASAERLLESVAQQVPNFGTEQDKAHCPFHLKTGACRFGQRCSRVHFYPDKACTLLMKNMYNGPGLACEQDEGLEHTDEEVEHCYEEFYEDVHTEFLKYGEIVNFKVCKNSSFHLRGNVYVHYKSLDSAVLAYQSINARYFAGKQISCEFVNLTRWKVAICGEYMKSRLKICSRGTSCNFIHCFRNPGGEYEWADWDKPPPRYWLKKMTALFGYSDESPLEKQMEQKKLDYPRMSSKTTPADRDRHRSRSRSRDTNHLVPWSGKSSDNEDDDQEGTHRHWRSDGDRKRIRIHCEKSYEKEYHHIERRSRDSRSEGGWSDRDNEVDKERTRHRDHVGKRSQYHDEVTEHSPRWSCQKSKDRNREVDSGEKYAHAEGSRHGIKRAHADDSGDRKNETNEMDVYQSDSEKHQSGMAVSSRHKSKDRDGHNRTKRKSSRHYSSSPEFQEDLHDNRYMITYSIKSDDDWFDKSNERRRSHKRRRSRQIEQKISDDEGTTAKSNETRSGSSKNHEFDFVDTDSRYRSIEETDELDRWKPESCD
ncbi:zinc finger CCCH domain-containing protein 5 isoform X2 [Mercurialis annua]|uniref:zinc finger CCCH domain-containing protein 5 isoform X2 n=1 Tax=Mercurialis annua TaxID=3986 RepID=UPI00215E3845|nr:zinc finger CCCH domain-containing protein 5 isoform X2 [Mercurialis annua]